MNKTIWSKHDHMVMGRTIREASSFDAGDIEAWDTAYGTIVKLYTDHGVPCISMEDFVTLVDNYKRNQLK